MKINIILTEQETQDLSKQAIIKGYAEINIIVRGKTKWKTIMKWTQKKKNYS